jgi:hypothetical protein
MPDKRFGGVQAREFDQAPDEWVKPQAGPFSLGLVPAYGLSPPAASDQARSKTLP